MIIVGEGNLAHALYEYDHLNRSILTNERALMHAKDNSQFPNQPKLIFMTVNVDRKQARDDSRQAYLTQVGVAKWLMEMAPAETKLVFFSTAEMADPAFPDKEHMTRKTPLSPYGSLMREFEETVLTRRRPLTTIVRIPTTYGAYKPRECFPGSLMSNLGSFPDVRLNFPSNEVTPTAVDWIVRRIRAADNLFHKPVHHLAPVGGLAVQDWAKMIAGPERCVRFLDRIRKDLHAPEAERIGCTVTGMAAPEHWGVIWERAWNPDHYRV